MAFCDFHYFSTALGKQTAAYVLLPEVGHGPFPVLYLLHGMSDDHTIWLRRTSIERYAQNLQLIIVMPDSGRGFYSDAHEGPAYDTALAIELVDRIDRTFPTKAFREGRAVAGLSMGGYGAMRFGINHPDRFCAAVSHSGALTSGHKNTGYDGKPLSPEIQRIFGPEPSGGPHDLLTMAENLDRSLLPALRIDCGTEDFLIEPNREFHAHLESLGIPHEYQEHPGAHNWEYWDEHIQETLVFLKGPLGL